MLLELPTRESNADINESKWWDHTILESILETIFEYDFPQSRNLVGAYRGRKPQCEVKRERSDSTENGSVDVMMTLVRYQKALDSTATAMTQKVLHFSHNTVDDSHACDRDYGKILGVSASHSRNSLGGEGTA